MAQLTADNQMLQTQLESANTQIRLLVQAAADNFRGAQRIVQWGVRLVDSPDVVHQTTFEDARKFVEGSPVPAEVMCRAVQYSPWVKEILHDRLEAGEVDETPFIR